MDTGGSLMEWVTQAARNVTKALWWDLLWSLMWGIWLRRNAWLFENRKVESWEVIERAVKLVQEYSNAMEEPRRG